MWSLFYNSSAEIAQKVALDAPHSNLFKPRGQEFVKRSQLISYSTQLIYVTVNNALTFSIHKREINVRIEN